METLYIFLCTSLICSGKYTVVIISIFDMFVKLALRCSKHGFEISGFLRFWY